MPHTRYSPLYRWLADTLREQIQHGQYKPGALLPAERELMQHYGLSSITVKRALGDLAAEGWIYRKAGKGTFVKRDKLEERLARLTSFAEVMKGRQIIPEYRLLRSEAISPPSHVATALRLPPDACAYLIERLHLAGGEPLALAVGYWTPQVGELLAARDLNRVPLYETVERELQIPLLEADESIGAVEADARTARLLNVHRHAPLLLQERLTFTSEMRPVHYTITYYRSDRYKYKIRLARL